MTVARLRNLLLTVTAGIGGLCLLVAAACAVFGLRPLVFESGSMSPAIPAGSVALARQTPAAGLHQGDVVSVIAANGVRVTHRIVAMDQAGPERLLTLQGDANSVPDREVYRVSQADRVITDVPWLGYLVNFLQGRSGLLLLGAAGAALLYIAFRPSPSPVRGRRRAARIALPVGSLALLAAQVTPTMAWFTDDGSATTGALATHTVVSPASASCSGALLTGTVSWPADARYDYEVILRRVSTSQVISTTQVTGSNASISYTGLTSFGSPVGLGTFDYQVEIRSYLANATTWRAATTRNYQYLRLVVVIVGATVSCTT